MVCCGTDEHPFALIARDIGLLNRQTGETKKTMLWLLDCRLSIHMLGYLLKGGYNMKTVRYGRTAALKEVKNG